jgi:hypothetical protein
MEDHIIDILVSKRFLVGVPKSEKDLRVQYPDMFDYPEFKRDAIRNSDDVLFVWWFRCACSPYYELPDEKKLEKCIGKAYKSEERKKLKKDEFLNLKFPDNMKAAFKRMEAINVGARVENFLYTKQVRENCKALLGKDVTKMAPEEQEDWAKLAKIVWPMLDETTKVLERGAYGVTEAEDAALDEDDSALRDFRNALN